MSFDAPNRERAAMISNQDFIRTIFSDAGPEAFAWVCSFQGDPKTASGSEWLGQSCRVSSLPRLDETGNTYFNVSTLKVHDGLVKRKGENFDELWVVALDDVRTKATLPEGFVPTYSIETSKNNFQCGLKLSVPLRDMDRAKALFKALAAKGFTDAGAQGPQSRYMRLPVGVNLKGACGPGGFPHRLDQWNPDLTFTVDEIVSIFGLDLDESAPEVTAKTTSPDRAKGEVENKADAIIIAKVLRSAKAQRVWGGDGDGFGSGSDADQYLLNLIAFQTEDADQVERIYSQSPRASRKSSDGTCKWWKRADYRKRSIESAFKFVEDHPQGDADEARATVEGAIATAKVSGDFRGIYAPDVVDAFVVLGKGDAANYDHLRQQARKAGATLSTLDAEVNRAGDAQNLSHDEAAELAISKLGGIESILHNQGSFWRWMQGLGVWKRIESDETIKKIIHGVLPRQQINGGTVGSVLSVLRTKVSREDVVFDAPRSDVFINCLSGTLCLKEGDYLKHDRFESWWELRPHRWEDYLTACVPVTWVEGAQCPRFEKYLKDVTEGDKDGLQKRQVLVEAIGYSLTQMTSEERFFILHGESSNNGKSTFLKVLESLAGKENTSALSLHQLGERFGLAGLQSKLINICAEIPRGAVLPDDVIKRLTSGDSITVERKGKDLFDIRPFATLVFATNTLPNLRDLSPATNEKRCILIEFNCSFNGDRRDAKLIDKLKAELPGIFWMSVETFGAAYALSRTEATWTYDADGARQPIAWFGGLLEDPPSSILAKAAWRKDSDPVQQFADDCLEAGPGSWLQASELFAAWVAWAESNGVPQNLNSRRLTARLGRLFPKIVTGDEARQGRTRGVRGLGFAKDAAR